MLRPRAEVDAARPCWPGAAMHPYMTTRQDDTCTSGAFPTAGSTAEPVQCPQGWTGDLSKGSHAAAGAQMGRGPALAGADPTCSAPAPSMQCCSHCCSRRRHHQRTAAVSTCNRSLLLSVSHLIDNILVRRLLSVSACVMHCCCHKSRLFFAACCFISLETVPPVAAADAWQS